MREKRFTTLFILLGLVVIASAVGVIFFFRKNNYPISLLEPLVSIYVHGGLCPNGLECSSTTEIAKDGSIIIDGKKKMTLDKAELTRLTNLVDTEDFKTLKTHKFTEVCPTSYDGSEVVYTFYTSYGTEKIASCKVAIDISAPLFSEINQVLFLPSF